MGGAFSCGEDNDDLVNILILLGYIRSKKVERVFRAVDRGDYVLSPYRDLAYKDLSWKLGNIHLSAPCVYCKVMEGLTLKPGLSFLNIGSGTGYLSTMAGLILGKNGTNHGIELHEDCLAYAYEHLEIFKKKSLDVDSFEFCEPAFQLGNILNATPNRQYDRVYCGAACPEIHEQYVKQFVKVGGILVMPYKDNLLRIERLDKNTWRNSTMLPVSFASLVTPPEGKERGLLQLPLWQPSGLQELCRNSIRCHLRKLVWSEHNDLEYKAPIKAQPIEHTIPQLHFGIPLFEEPNRGQSDSDSSEDDDDEMVERTPTFFQIEANRRDVMTSTLRLVRAVVQPNQGSENRDEDRRDMQGTSDDTEEVDHPERSRKAEPENSTKEVTNLETEMQEDFFEAANHAPMEDDDFMDVAKEENFVETKEGQDADIEDYDIDQTDAPCARSPNSKLKRKSEALGSNGEPHNSRCRLLGGTDVSEEDSGDKAPTTSSSDPTGSISDPDDEDLLNFAWIEQAFSILKDKFQTEMEENSDSTSGTSNSSNVDLKSDDPLRISSNHVGMENAESESDEENGSLFARLLASKIEEKREESTPNDRESRGHGSRSSMSDKMCSKNGNSRKSVDPEAVEDEDEDEKMPDKSESCSDFSSDEEAKEKTKYRRCLRSGQKRRSEQRSYSSGSNGPSDNTYASDCSDSTASDPEFDFNFMHQPNLKRNIYAHTIRKEQISHFMQRKVASLPLPLPLRLYVNYNREL